MVKFGFPWPQEMNCDILPVDECIRVDSGASIGLLFLFHTLILTKNLSFFKRSKAL